MIDNKPLLALALATLMVPGAAYANTLSDEIATPLLCSEYGDSGPLIPDRGPERMGDGGTVQELDSDPEHDQCFSGSKACESAKNTDSLGTPGLGAGELSDLGSILRHSGADCSGNAKCGPTWLREWAVEGEYQEGDGEVKFWVQCGPGQDSAQTPGEIACDAIKPLVYCKDGPEGEDGEFGCWYEVVKGDPLDIWGKCVDPLNPGIVYGAIPAGSEERYNVFLHGHVVR